MYDRRKVLEKSERKCHYCGHPLTLNTMHVDHIRPRKAGGSDSLENLVAACPACNVSKGSKVDDNWKPKKMYEKDEELENALNNPDPSWNRYTPPMPLNPIIKKEIKRVYPKTPEVMAWEDDDPEYTDEAFDDLLSGFIADKEREIRAKTFQSRRE